MSGRAAGRKAQKATLTLLCVAILLLVYGLTMPPTLSWAHNGADGGDLVTAALLGRLPHPPGFPTWMLLARFFLRLPWGDPAWRLNLFSALSAALSAAFLCRAARHLPLAPRPLPLAPVAALALGLSPLLWSQALIAEVYAPAALFAALLLWLALRGCPAWALGLLWGLGLGVHPTLLFLAPLVGWAAWQGAARWRRTGEVALAALVATGLAYGPGLLLWRTPSPWGSLATPADWWAYVSGRLYHGYLLALPLAAWPARLWAWAALLARQFTPPGAALAGWGWWTLRRAQPGLAWATLAAFGGFSLYALSYNTADSFVYLTAALPLAALWLAAGLAQAALWLDARWKRGRLLLLALPLLQLVLFWGAMDVSADRSALSWAEEVLAAAPPNAVVITAADAHTFALWYTHDGLGQRPDVVIIDRDLWAQDGYRRMVSAALGATAADIDTATRQAARPLVIADE